MRSRTRPAGRVVYSGGAPSRQRGVATRAGKKRTAPVRLDDPDMIELGIKSFRAEYKALRRAVGSEAGDDFTSARAATALARAQLSMAVNAMPVIEANVHQYKNERAVYALVALSTLIRELSHDIKTQGSGEEMIDKVTEQVARPALQDAATRIVAHVLTMKRELHQRVKDPALRSFVDARLGRLQASIADVFTTADESTRDRLTKLLSIS